MDQQHPQLGQRRRRLPGADGRGSGRHVGRADLHPRIRQHLRQRRQCRGHGDLQRGGRHHRLPAAGAGLCRHRESGGLHGRHEHDHDGVQLHGGGGRLGPERRRDRGEQAHRRHDLRHRQHHHQRRPHPQLRVDRRRAQGRRHPPDARHHRRRCADDVDRRHAGDPDVQRDHQRGRSEQDRHRDRGGATSRQRARRTSWLEPRSNSTSAPS